MTDDFTILNPGSGGDTMDESSVAYGTAPFNRKRPRVVIAGEGVGEIVPALNESPSGNEYGTVTRPILAYPGTSVVSFNVTTLVANGIESTITSYTVPMGKTFFFLGFLASGNTNALFKLYVNSDVVLAGRSSVANLTLSLNFPVSPLQLEAGSTIILKTIHDTNASCDFEGTILGYIV